MSFPLSPSNGQTTVLNGITYAYNSAKGAWIRQIGSLTATTTLLVSNTASSNSTITGALVVAGGVGVGGAVYIANTSYVAGAQIVTTATVAQYINGGTSTSSNYANTASTLVISSTSYGTYNIPLISATNGNLNVLSDASAALTYNPGTTTLSIAGTITATNVNIIAPTAFSTGGSLYFNGSSYITIPYTASYFDWWPSDYTFECWVYASSYSGWHDSAGYGSIIGNMVYNGTNNDWSFGINSSGKLVFYRYNPTNITSTGTVPLNQWVHIAFSYVASSTTMYFFINGVASGSNTITGVVSNSSYGLTIGAYNSSYVTGYITNLRIVKGTALYTSSFLPPTQPLTSVTNTVLLLDAATSATYIADSVGLNTVTNHSVAFNSLAPYNGLGLPVASVSTNTGALTVAGGVGVGGAVYIANTSYIAGAQIITTATIGNYAAAGSGGASSTGTTSTFTISSTATSTSTITGALVVTGGVGIGGNLNVGGTVIGGGVRTTTTSTPPANPTVGDIWYYTNTDQIFRYTQDSSSTYWLDITGPTQSTQSSTGNIAGGVAGQIPYQIAPGQTGFVAQGTPGYILVSAGTGSPYWTTSTNVVGGGGNASFGGTGTFTSLIIGSGAVLSNSTANTTATTVTTVALMVDSTDAIQVPVGTTAQRPTYATNGMVRYNSSTGAMETFIAGTWINMAVSSYTINYLIVGGGGGGGGTAACNVRAGGGGAGGVITGTTTLIPGYPFTVTVGAGGAGGVGLSATGGTGVNSTFLSITALGGGGGGTWASAASGGASGGGGGTGGAGGTAGGCGTAGQGFKGGAGVAYSPAQTTSGGGGGGAGSVGQAASGTTGGNGGSGYTWPINLSSYAGGGGGGGAATGGTTTGGGGAGAAGGNTNGTSGTGGSGGGGGGSASSNGGPNTGGSGGGGVVIVSYQAPSQRGSGGSVTYVTGSVTTWYHTFLASGTYIA